MSRIAVLYFYEVDENLRRSSFEPEQIADPKLAQYFKGADLFDDYATAKAVVDKICADCLEWCQRNTKGFHWTRGTSKSGHELVFQLVYQNIEKREWL